VKFLVCSVICKKKDNGQGFGRCTIFLTATYFPQGKRGFLMVSNHLGATL